MARDTKKKPKDNPGTGQTRKKKPANQKKHRALLQSAIIIGVILIVLFILTPTERPQAYVERQDNLVTESVLTGGVILDIELPASREGDIIVRHSGYTLSYSEDHEQPWWVAYELTAEEVYGLFERGDDFRADPSIPTGSATPADYTGSGYDRGHLIPAADLSWSAQAMSESFFMSNMSPQTPQLNRGMWSSLEAIVRQNAVTEGRVAVVTGPVLTDGPYETIGTNKVAVPKYYYKVLLDYTGPTTKAIGFILPNQRPGGSIQDYVVTVSEVEDVTGLDFFHRLPDDIEKALEGSVNAAAWDWKRFSATKAEKEQFLASLGDGPTSGESSVGTVATGTTGTTGNTGTTGTSASSSDDALVLYLRTVLYDTLGDVKKNLLVIVRDTVGL
ncbi:DNA/RNA non-specific endonuclease [Parasphaerochaeta coccoides]|uniref:Endonuclease n=1 Tax=Parasphaerochaeta coccoides (strain ATCC BAA-1237 / DSM 17374 / SPN1) TaxID=760011 RepID=F4GI43_PARC1|nr:DNA/RNA non-specific endonuclease [Parasphaerochaeta coccoides]AEC02641.1 DNA/RNA non-specific endonuclease [Parasphaerochaeta coccoides DSM 17374]